MADYLVKGASLTAIADAIRSKTGETRVLTLDGMAAAISSIPVGSGGSSGGSVETCTVNITDFSDGWPLYTVTTTIVDGIETPYVRLAEYLGTEEQPIPPYTISNVKCGTAITVVLPCAITNTPCVEVDGGATLIKASRVSDRAYNSTALMFVFTAPETAGANATILASCM